MLKEEDDQGRPGKRISIFLAVWNVHVNRAPAEGKITRIEYKPGKFLAAWDEDASLQNEQNIFSQATEHGEIVYKQIAGWVARRVVSWKKEGTMLTGASASVLFVSGLGWTFRFPAERKLL